MPNYDATELRAKLANHMQELGDALTAQEEAAQFAQLCATLRAICDTEKPLLARGAGGTFPPLDEESKAKLQTLYEEALQQALALQSEEESGGVGTRMRAMAYSLAQFLLIDGYSLGAVDLAATPMTLPELLRRAREQAVDLGEQPGLSADDFKTPQRIIVDGDTGEDSERNMEEGFFVASMDVTPREQFQTLTRALAEAFPPYEALLGELTHRGFGGIRWDVWADGGLYEYALEHAADPASPESLQNALRERIRGWYLNGVVSPVTIELAEQHDDYLAFFDRLYAGMSSIGRLVVNYMTTGRQLLAVKEGANIDRRSAAMSRVAALLGKGDLVASARTMALIVNGVTVSGTFELAAHGEDVERGGAYSALAGYDAKVYENPRSFGDVAAVQVLDWVCGNANRRAENIITRYEPDAKGDPKLIGVTLVDNENSFAASVNGLTAPEQMGAVGEDVYSCMKLMTREQLTLLLLDIGLSKQELDAVWQRKEKLLTKLEADRAYYKDKELGYLEPGYLRIVPHTEWRRYSARGIARAFPQSSFKQMLDLPQAAKGGALK